MQEQAVHAQHAEKKAGVKLPANWNQPIGYEVDTTGDDRLYPQRSSSSSRRFRPLDTQGASQPVIYQRRQQLRTRDQYDEVNYFIRTRPKGATPHQQLHTMKEHAPKHSQGVQTDANEPETQPPLCRAVHDDTTRLYWSGYIGLGMVGLLSLGIAIVVVFNWWHGFQDDLHYGRPRTYQTDARVGHDDTRTPSHFIALNLNGQVEVIEFPAGDATQAKVYMGPTLSGQDSDLAIVTISFKDVNGDGKPDMILEVKNEPYVFINDNGTFRAIHPDDHIKM